MSIQGKTYANKHGKAEGRQNKVQITMDIEDAEGIASGDKALRAELSKAIKSVAKGSKK
jgi:hypothetical protein